MRLDTATLQSLYDDKRSRNRETHLIQNNRYGDPLYMHVCLQSFQRLVIEKWEPRDEKHADAIELIQFVRCLEKLVREN